MPNLYITFFVVAILSFLNGHLNVECKPNNKHVWAQHSPLLCSCCFTVFMHVVQMCRLIVLLKVSLSHGCVIVCSWCPNPVEPAAEWILLRVVWKVNPGDTQHVIFKVIFGALLYKVTAAQHLVIQSHLWAGISLKQFKTVISSMLPHSLDGTDTI